MIYDKPTGEIFASEAGTGEGAEFPDIQRGWGITKEQTASKPPMSWMNGAFKRIDENLEYLRQRGIAEWDEKLTYPVGAYVQHMGKTWKSKSENTGKEPSVDDLWIRWGLTQEEIDALISTAGNDKLDKQANLSDLTSAYEALTNLGIADASSRNGITASDTTNGWISIPLLASGKQKKMIIQWGSVILPVAIEASHNGWDQFSQAFSFPVPFPNLCLSVTCSLLSGGSIGQWVTIAQVLAINQSIGRALVQTISPGAASPSVQWIAIGF